MLHRGANAARACRWRRIDGPYDPSKMGRPRAHAHQDKSGIEFRRDQEDSHVLIVGATTVLRGLYRYASLSGFYRLTERLVPWLGGITVLLFVVGLYGGLVLAPADYQQGDSYRIIFVHVPSAWMSLFVYLVMAGFAAI